MGEHQVAFAEALAAINDPASEMEFDEAVRRVSNLHDPNPILELRVHEHFARYLVGKRQRSRALDHYQSAKKLAVECRLFEDSARIQLLIIPIALEIDEDPAISSFQTLRQAAKDGSYTAKEQLAAWTQYLGDTREQGHGLLAARKRSGASVEYFRGLLDSVREEQRDEIPG